MYDGHALKKVSFFFFCLSLLPQISTKGAFTAAYMALGLAILLALPITIQAKILPLVENVQPLQSIVFCVEDFSRPWKVRSRVQ